MKSPGKARPKSGVRGPKSLGRPTPDRGLRGSEPRPRTLIIGYGNPLRGDDGFGWHATRSLMPLVTGCDAEVLTCHQLTPELAEPLSRCGLAIFLDADARGMPGQIRRGAIRAAGGEAAAFTHACCPSSLLAAAKKLYGARPRGVAITVGVETCAYGETLSPAVEGAIPRVVDLVGRLVAGRALPLSSSRQTPLRKPRQSNHRR